MAVTSAIVLGAGLAGMAAALHLADHGVRVTLIEATKRLGGRASSFDDPVLGRTDRGQHVTMGCCRNHLAFLERLNARHYFRFTTLQTWIDESGSASHLRAAPLPPPLAFAPSIATAGFLSVEDKARLVGAFPALLSARPMPGDTFETFLQDQHQSDRLIKRLWEPLAVGACNVSSRHLSAELAISVVRRGFFASGKDAAIGVADCPLEDLYQAFPGQFQSLGGELLLEERVESFDEASVTLRSGTRRRADVVVCSLPFRQAARLASDPLSDPRLDACRSLTPSPIVCVHLLYDRPVMDEPHAVLLGRTSDWLFRGGEGDRIAGVISAASPFDDTPLQDIAARVDEDARAVLPRARIANLLRARAVRERDATFAATPGLVRPSTTGPTPLLLAGDYTDTGWPATMEGAVISGAKAAAAALGLAEDTFVHD